MSINKDNPPSWSKLKDESIKPLEPLGGSWPLTFFKRNAKGQFTNLQGKLVRFQIRNPKLVDFYKEQLAIVQEALRNLTWKERNQIEYFGYGVPTKQWTPILDRLIETYDLNPLHAARTLQITQAAIQDAFIITWSLKYHFDIARPYQLDPKLKTVIPTPPHPAYPSGHSVVSGCAETVLSYFFPGEATRLKDIAKEASNSRVLGGIHFPIDCDEGLRLGKQIGNEIIKRINEDKDKQGNIIDNPKLESKHAVLPPPPYTQIIPYPPNHTYDPSDLFKI